MGEAVVLSYVRTAIADAYRGSLVGVDVRELGKLVVAEAVKRAGVEPDAVDDVVLGEVLQGGGCLARYIALDLGLPADTPGMAVQQQCGTGLAAVNVAAGSIRAGMDRVVVAGGIEHMTGSPPMPPGLLSHPETADAPAMNMGVTVGENTAERCGVTREEMDEWAYHSHRRAVAAIDAGVLAQEIVPVEVDGGVFDTDEHPRRDTSLEKLASLKPAFPGTTRITAGNSSSINDAAAALVVADADWASAAGLRPLGIVRSWAACGVPPRDTGIAPTLAVPRAVERAGLTLGDIDLVEINEAFASMAVACTRELGFSHEQVNVNGGAVALGHPVAASGARILGHLLLELRRRGQRYGVASLCAGGGMGVATVVEALPA